MGGGGGEGGLQPATPFLSATQSSVFKSGSSALRHIGVPSIISQKTRNIGPKLVKYWLMSKTLKIHYTDAEPMRSICGFQIVLRRRPDRAQ